MGRSVAVAIVVTGCHLFVSFVLFTALFAAGMDRFDHGGEPARWEGSAEVALGTLSFPVVVIFWLLPLRLPALLQNTLFIANSVLWGFVASKAVLILRQRQQTDPN